MRSALALLLLGALPARAQAPTPPGEVNLIGARVSVASARIGEAFELTVTAHLPPGHLVYFPDQLATPAGVESVGAPAWTMEPLPGDSTALTLVYRFRSFVWGIRQLPPTELVLHRIEKEGAGAAGPSTRVGPWADAAALAQGTFSRRPIVPGTVEIQPVLPMSRPEAGLPLRARQDVLGRDRSLLALALLGAAGAILLAGFLGALRRAGRRLWSRWKRRAAPPARNPISSRSMALAELDEILGLGLHTSGRFDELYTRAGATTRRYVESLDEELGPALTYRELVRRLAPGGAPRAIEPLREVLGSAEVVRFGARHPDAPRAEADLRTLRQWLERYPPTNGTS